MFKVSKIDLHPHHKMEELFLNTQRFLLRKVPYYRNDVAMLILSQDITCLDSTVPPMVANANISIKFDQTTSCDVFGWGISEGIVIHI